MSPIKFFSLSYEALNEEDTFTQGDTISGTVSFYLTKNTKVKSIVVKVKGDANVAWEDEDEQTYSAHRRYFKVTEHLIAEGVKETALPKGSHDFKFRLRIPEGDMPPPFKGASGKIIYQVEAKISRSWRWPSTVHKEIKFVPKHFPVTCQVMCGQSGSVNSKIGFFGKGHVEMFASVNRKACCPGDTLSAFAKISNSSSKSMRPKFCLQQKTVYTASGQTSTCDKSMFKMFGETITSNSEVTVPCEVKIPADAIYSLLNCEIISVEYYLKVYLDISFAFDPEVIFPLLVVPPSIASIQLGASAPSYSDFAAPAFSGAPNFLHAASQPPQASEMSPHQHSGCYNQWPVAGANPVSSPAVHPASADPPSYSSLYLPSHDPLGRGGAVQKQ